MSIWDTTLRVRATTSFTKTTRVFAHRGFRQTIPNTVCSLAKFLVTLEVENNRKQSKWITTVEARLWIEQNLLLIKRKIVKKQTINQNNTNNNNNNNNKMAETIQFITVSILMLQCSAFMKISPLKSSTKLHFKNEEHLIPSVLENQFDYKTKGEELSTIIKKSKQRNSKPSFLSDLMTTLKQNSRQTWDDLTQKGKMM